MLIITYKIFKKIAKTRLSKFRDKKKILFAFKRNWINHKKTEYRFNPEKEDLNKLLLKESRLRPLRKLKLS